MSDDYGVALPATSDPVCKDEYVNKDDQAQGDREEEECDSEAEEEPPEEEPEEVRIY
jgi:hypothetical protein